MSKLLENYLEELQMQEDDVEEAGFENMPKGWDNDSIKKWANTLVKNESVQNAAKKKGFFDKCVRKVSGKVQNPEGLCAAVKDSAYKSTYWRGANKSAKEVNKNVKQHHNVK